MASFVLTIVTFGVSRLIPSFERIFPWIAITATPVAALFRCLLRRTFLGYSGDCLLYCRTICIHGSALILTYGSVLSFVVLLSFIIEYPYQEQIAASKGKFNACFSCNVYMVYSFKFVNRKSCKNKSKHFLSNRASELKSKRTSR